MAVMSAPIHTSVQAIGTFGSQLYNIAKSTVIAPTETIARRLITYSEAAPIAKEAEELLLFKDMQVELAERILRQVAVARRNM